MAGKVQEPEKELRFTRARQAVVFWIFGAMMVGVSVTLGASVIYRDVNPDLPHPLWVVVPVVLAGVSLRWAVRMTRHAYVILTPLGVEVFPFYRPEKHMQMIFWLEIAMVETDERMSVLTLHYNAEKTSGMHLTLSPIPKNCRMLLIKAIQQRVLKAG